MFNSHFDKWNWAWNSNAKAKMHHRIRIEMQIDVFVESVSFVGRIRKIYFITNLKEYSWFLLYRLIYIFSNQKFIYEEKQREILHIFFYIYSRNLLQANIPDIHTQSMQLARTTSTNVSDGFEWVFVYDDFGCVRLPVSFQYKKQWKTV